MTPPRPVPAAHFVPAAVAGALLIATAAGAVLGAVLGRRRAVRDAVHHAALAPVISDLGRVLYAVVAASQRLGSARDDARYRAHKARAVDSARELDRLRMQVRAPLYGLNDAFHTLVMLPHRAERLRGDDAALRRLVALATELRIALDDAIRHSWFRGRPPTRRDRAHAAACTRALHAFAASQRSSIPRAGGR